ncbi:MAG: trypsin-like peptidase domain-containing protein [Pelomonas sp.]|nr:trypsin-like peptidase domain-containing protein [Roseateles sp.]
MPLSRHPAFARLALLLAVLALLLVGGGAPAATRPQPASFADAFQRGAAWSVGVYMFVPGEDEPRVGAGFFIDDKGSIATAAHLLGEAQQILVALPDKRLVAAEIIGQDEVTDIALLRIAGAPRVHPVFAPGGSLRVGDWVIAVGEPFGLEHSVSAGIVSGKDRHFGDDGELVFIQSDVALNPGNSGGPLLDAQGAIVGMNARTIVGPVGTPGASLAIPIDLVLQVVAEFRQEGKAPARPRLGAQFDDVSPMSAWAAGRRETSGALILSVPHGTLAEKLQLRAGDVVTSMNGRRIGGSADLVAALLAWRSLEGTRIVVLRGGQETVLTAD